MENSQILAKKIRISSLEMVSRANASHIGSAFSITEILSVLYTDIMKFDCNNPQLKDRDRLILSKGHACVALYAALAHSGFIDLDELQSFGQPGSRLMAHISHKVPGVEFSTGSLGHGLPFAVGKALSAKLQFAAWQTFVIVGDGELDEGSNWEAMMFAAHHKLNNLTVIIDGNNLQSLTTTTETLNLEPIKDKFLSFGADFIQVDGHDVQALKECLNRPRSNRPLVIMAKTTKGKGVSFMENSVAWHYMTPKAEVLEQALNEVRT